VVGDGDTPQDEISLAHETESQATQVNMRKRIQSLRPVTTDVMDLQTKKKQTNKQKQSNNKTPYILLSIKSRISSP